ncbi:hypothetical protein CH330_05210 [candidate division WOR-3 bacterium JGI_Cruoil_03_51_56]|uniref:EVE domain-containing protein n=1 Tax=candidate division WOR-3 bacterium JGI_Cruoil_03_51_56 TaxID=1973747 RepID=A0A235BT34_UNCW3|nr:MAG: hypothetical protein CH330_05210 [candidate division WOR-3 bacterium JGI_Cruoil_03_51_56]
MNITLGQVLNLIGKLDDSSGENTPSMRFRQFLAENVKEPGQLRDYVQECLRTAGPQFNRALQDLVNHLGRFLGFDVTFGRYQGVQGAIGYDGHWKSPSGFNIVVEVKTTEVYAVRTATLMDYVNRMISDKLVPDWNHTLGLYVVGRPDPEVNQLENAIVAEKRIHQLRVASVESLLSLAELMHDYDIEHDDIMAVLRPSGPRIDPIVNFISKVVVSPPEPPKGEVLPTIARDKPAPEQKGESAFWLTPVRSDEKASADDVIRTLVGKHKAYAFGERTPGRRHLKSGDWICFYACTEGVVAHARVVTAPTRGKHPAVRDPEKYPWVFNLDSVSLYLDNPVVIDADLRAKLDGFKERDPSKFWAWFVQATRQITEHDFKVLTRSES